MPRILYVSRGYTCHDRRFLSAIAERSHDVHFLSLEPGVVAMDPRPLPARVRRVDWEGGRWPPQGPDAWLSLMPALEAVIEDIRPDLIHAGPVPSCGFLASLLDTHPLLLMAWGSDLLVDAERDPLWRWLSRYALSHSDMLLCDSPAVRCKAQQLVAYPGERIVEFPWGVEIEAFRPDKRGNDLRRQLGWDTARVVLSTRGWGPLYGTETLVEAFAQAAHAEPRLRLLLLGDGPSAETAQQLLGQGRLDGLVFAAGYVPQPDIVSYFQLADVYMSCALSDGTSVSLLEALAVGLPVVVTDHPGNRAWVQSGVNGWLGSPGDADSFAAALLTASQLSTTEREAIGQRNRQLAEERADWARNVEKLFAAYQTLLNRAACGSPRQVGG